MKASEQKKTNIATTITTDLPFVDLTFISKKLPSWAAHEGLHFPTRLCLEQCSGEKAALYKSLLIERLFPKGGNSMADLTGGLGVDFSFIAPHFKRAVYMERQNVLCEAARHNFPLLGLDNVDIIEGDGIERLHELSHQSLIFIDPARRDIIGKKTVFIEDCEPDVLSLLPTLWEKTDCVILKLSPMLDLTKAIQSLQHVSEAHIFADNRECKELLLVLQKGAAETRIFCADHEQTFSYTPDEETKANVTYTTEPKKYLYEPGAAILKGGAFKLVAQRYQLEKLHPNSHLYTSEKYVTDFPGRSFEVKQVGSFAKKELKALCNSVEKANLTVRNFPGTVAELRKRMKLKEGGDAYWFATTLANNKHVIIDCRKVTTP